ncbi:MAG TPA: GerAB/ArcD/ProY family transporter [Symbiobacteriaceae bacterium]|nr:GerAB/ArcD/ProY family transporter [Symbiobacteriaceae bacterium]
MILLLPTVAVEAGGRAAWMVAFISGFSGFLMLLLVGKLAQRFPAKTFPTYASEILGKWPGKILAFVMAVNFGLNASVDLGVAVKNLEGIYFVNTPPWVIALILAVMALATTWFGLVHASRLAPALLALLFLTFVLTFPLLWRWMKPGYLIPLFDVSQIDFGGKAFWVSMGVIRAALFPVVFLPYVKEPRKAIRTLAWAHWIGWVGNFLAVITPVMVFGPAGARAISQPFPFVIAVLRVENFPFERLEMLGRLAFHVNTVYAIACIYFTGGLFFADVFGVKSVRPFMPVMAGLSMAPLLLIPSAVRATEFAYGSVLRGLAAAGVTFPVLWVVYLLRGLHRKNRRAAAAQ